MFFEQHFEASSLDSKLKGGNMSLVELLNDENILQEVSAGNAVVIQFLATNCQAFLKHALQVPADTSGLSDCCLQAHQVLSTGNEALLRSIVVVPGALETIFATISDCTSRNVPPTILHFITLVMSLIQKESGAVLAFIKRTPAVMSYLLHHIGCSGIDGILHSIFMQTPEFTSWCVNTGKFTDCFLASLCSPTVPIDPQVSAMSVIMQAIDVPASSDSAACVAPFVQSIVGTNFLGTFVAQGLMSRSDGPFVDKAVDVLTAILVSRFRSARLTQLVAAVGPWLKAHLPPPKTAAVDKGAGIVRIQGFNLAARLVECGVTELVVEHGLDVIAVQCLQKYPRNNIIHHVITRMFTAFVTQAPPERCRMVLQRCRLCPWLAQNDNANVQRRSAFGGHAIDLMTTILGVLPATGITEDSVQGLAEYKAGVYQKALALQSNPLLGVNPVSCKTNVPVILPSLSGAEDHIPTGHEVHVIPELESNMRAPEIGTTFSDWTTFSETPQAGLAFLPTVQPSGLSVPPSSAAQPAQVPIDDFFSTPTVVTQQSPPTFQAPRPAEAQGASGGKSHDVLDDIFGLPPTVAVAPLPSFPPTRVTAPPPTVASMGADWDLFGTPTAPQRGHVSPVAPPAAMPPASNSPAPTGWVTF